ncbi:putative Polyadenylate-binding protein-interacting protein 8 [Cocos nucifera]|uniref:Putative Polyadenylate-binding protein-interacting protein 8 n=1 Tax=Cocos nucifera TaxID=13894 RepID=A0A8K0IUI3_COCNU|nr:putative Polyadenylate-binding protein-interacting protein 8 [Cocos nucifera]
MAAVAENAIGAGEQFVRRPSPSPPQQKRGGASEAEYQRDVRELVELLSKLNPSAKEFIPSYASAASPPLAAGQDAVAAAAQTADGGRRPNGRLSADAPVFVASSDYYGRPIGGENRSYLTLIPGLSTDQAGSLRITVFCLVLDCRICCDANSVLRFAFVEFANEYGARTALNLDGTVLGYYPVRVLPSKTAILPVNPTLLPQLTQTDLQEFFQSCCGEVSRLRLLGDNVHSTRIAFVEFVQAESALRALNCSGMVLGALPIRMDMDTSHCNASYYFDPFYEHGGNVCLVRTSILSMESVIRRIPLHKLKRDTIFADVLSVKQFPRNLFVEVLPPGFGIACTHPMFGPESGRHGWVGLPFIYDQVRVLPDSLQAQKCARFLNIFEREVGNPSPSIDHIDLNPC